ncbi:MAG: hypothetical protein IJT18_05290 [Oscillospiraceae bacterium]|nr:hypothetical protein [Oscillospiraceae bacterium]
MEEKKKPSLWQKSYLTLILALLALIGIAGATAAWFSLGDHGRVYSMQLDITTGAALRFDTVQHAEFTDYQKTLSFTDIAAAVRQQYGYDMRTTPLRPVTTANGTTFTLRDGTVVQSNSGSYWEIPLHFIANEDLIVHLTADNSLNADDGTRISSSRPTLPRSMRISFDSGDSIAVYDPGMGDSATTNGKIKNFGLQTPPVSVYNQNSVLFSLKKDTDKLVILRIWMEGTDEACTDELKNADFRIQLRFDGTDENGGRLDGRRGRPEQ